MTSTEVLALLVPFVTVDGPEQPLKLESIEIAMLIESIEDTFDIVIRASDYDPAAFTRVDLLAAWIDRLRNPS